MNEQYCLKETGGIISPALIYYRNMICENIEKAIRIAGRPERLWPHVKSHKAAGMLKLQMEYGITKFKTATVAEAEMAAEAGAEKVILAYPLVGPNVRRYLELAKAFPETEFYAVGENITQFEEISDMGEELCHSMNCLVDVNMGMNRTGVELDGLEELYRRAFVLAGTRMKGLHCYDGHHNQSDIRERRLGVEEVNRRIREVIGRLQADGMDCPVVVAGGTPSFPCHAMLTDWFLSPGTAFLTDAGYYINLPDLDFIPAAAVMTRVVSHPSKGMFTVDLGYKGIASDPAGIRGYIVGLEDAYHVLHSEEHWVFGLKDEARIPEIGTCLYVIPTHICPTSALYQQILVAQDHTVTERWDVTARNRKLTF